MKVYLDAGLLITTLVETDGSAAANRILSGAGAPFELNLLHQLQAENLLTKLLISRDRLRKAAGTRAAQLWKRYAAEEVFSFTEPDWQEALRLATVWTRSHAEEPPPPLLILHPCLALFHGATHFASFDPRSRKLASAASLALLPATL